jgi:autophagy-related protein 18
MADSATINPTSLPPKKASTTQVLCTNFNQDASSVCVGTKSGLRIWSIGNAGAEVAPLHKDESNLRISLAARLFSSSLLVIVSQAQPRKLRVFHFRKDTEICAYSYSSAILSVKLNRLRLVVMLENGIYIHNIKDMKLLNHIKDIPTNPRGVCCLSTTSHHPLLVYPGSTVNGQVHVYDCESLRATAAIQAHRSPVVALAIYDKESDRTLDEIPDNHTSAIYQVPDTRAILATASSTGTVVRLWVMKTLGTVEQIAELRRGVRRHALVESMNFSADGKWLALTSDTETIHIWRLDKLQSDNKSKSFDNSSPETSATQQVNATSVQNLTNTLTQTSLSGWMNWGVNTAVGYAKDVLPAALGNSLSAERAFITAQLPANGLKSQIAVMQNGSTDYNSLRILACTKEGYLLVYDANSEDGGEANLIKQHRLVENEDDDDSEGDVTGDGDGI